MTSCTNRPVASSAGAILGFQRRICTTPQARVTRRSARSHTALSGRAIVSAAQRALEWYVKEVGFAPLLTVMGHTPGAAFWHLVVHELERRPAVVNASKHPAALSRGVIVAIQALTTTSKEKNMTDIREMVSVRYMVDDVDKAVEFYTRFLGFEVLNKFPPFADVARGKLRLLLSGPQSSAGRPMADGTKPGPGGWNRIHLIVDDIEAEVARLKKAGAPFRNDIIEGPGGKQVLLKDPSGNFVELFQMAALSR